MLNIIKAICLKRLLLTVVVLFFACLVNAQLQADFSTDKAGGCSPFSVSFTNASRGASPDAVYYWDFGNGNTSALKDPGAVYIEEKAYTVTLTVTDGDQHSSTSKTITVYKKPEADFKPASAKVCMPSAAVFMSTSDPGDGYISSLYWDFGDGNTQQSFSNLVSRSYGAVQKPTVSLTVTNSYGCHSSIMKTEVVEILPAMQPAFSVNKSLFCETSDLVQLTNSSTGPGTLSYAWDFGDGQASTVKDPSHVYNKKGLFNIRMTLSNEHGCSASASPAQVNIAYFNTDFSSSMLCREVYFNQSSYIYPSSVMWDFGDGVQGLGNSINHTYATPGRYTVKLVNTYGVCKDEVSKIIEVKDLVTYNSDFTMPAEICVGAGFYLSARSSVNPSGRSWDLGNGIWAGSSATPYISYNVPGTYTIKLTHVFGTCKEEVTKTIIVNALPDIKDFDVNYGGLCGAPVAVSFKDNTPDAVKWSWDLHYNVRSTLQAPTHTYTNDGTYYVQLTVTNAAGCTRSTSKYISIQRPGNVNIFETSTLFPGGVPNCGTRISKFSASSSEEIASYKWDFGDNTSSTDKEPEHTYSRTGSYNVTLTYITKNGCTGISRMSSIMVYDKPTADFNYYVAPCSSQGVMVTFTNTSNKYTHMSWDYGDGALGSSPAHSYGDIGKYTVTLVNYHGGCSERVTKEINADKLPSFVNIGSIVQSCAPNGLVTFDQSSLRATGNAWRFGDGAEIPYNIADHAVKHTYTRSGRYTVSLTGTYGTCPLTSSREVIVFLKQAPVLAVNRNSICLNESVNVSISNVEVSPYGNDQYGQYHIVKFEYDDGTPFTGLNNYTWRYNNYSSGIYGLKRGDVRIRAIIRRGNTNCLDTTNYVSIKVNGPEAGFKITTNDVCWKSPLAFEDASKTFTNTPIKTWQWSFGDGNAATRDKGGVVSHTYNRPGSYPVTLTVTDEAGCSSTSYSPGGNANARGPVASFTPTGLYVPDVPLNTTINFVNNSNVGYSSNTSYLWEYGNGVSSTDFNGLQTYTQTGDYTIKLTVTDPVASCTDATTRVIHVKDFNTAFKFATTQIGANGCPPVMVRINNLSVGFNRLEWDFGDNTKTETQLYPNHIYYQPGTYKIVLKTYGPNGLSGTYTDHVIIEKPSITSFDADVLEGCVNQEVTLAAAAVKTSSYLWDFGDGTLLESTNGLLKHKYKTAGIFTPQLIVKHETGCRSGATFAKQIFIDSLDVSLKNLPLNICQFSDNIFKPVIYSAAENLAAKTLTYHWDYGTGNTADVSDKREGAFRYNKEGKYTVRLKAESPLGCIDEATHEVEVIAKFGLRLKAPAQVDVCMKEQVVLTASGAHTYEWIKNISGLSDTNVPNPVLSTLSDGIYTVVGHDKYHCSTDTTKISVYVRPLPTVNAGQDVEILANTIQQLEASGSSDVIRWSWTPADYLDCTDCYAPVAKPKRHMEYIVKAATKYNCSSVDTVRVKVLCLDGYIYIPNTFTPNRDNKNDVFYIKGKGVGTIKSLRIFNRWGFMVFERKNFDIDDRSAGWSGFENGRPVPAGAYVYIAEMQCEGEAPFIRKGSVMVVY